MMSKGGSIEIAKSMLSWTWQCDNWGGGGLKRLNVNVSKNEILCNLKQCNFIHYAIKCIQTKLSVHFVGSDIYGRKNPNVNFDE